MTPQRFPHNPGTFEWRLSYSCTAPLHLSDVLVISATVTAPLRLSDVSVISAQPRYTWETFQRCCSMLQHVAVCGRLLQCVVISAQPCYTRVTWRFRDHCTALRLKNHCASSKSLTGPLSHSHSLLFSTSKPNNTRLCKSAQMSPQQMSPQQMSPFSTNEPTTTFYKWAQ